MHLRLVVPLVLAVEFYADLADRFIRENKVAVIIVGDKLVKPAAGKIIARRETMQLMLPVRLAIAAY